VHVIDSLQIGSISNLDESIRLPPQNDKTARKREYTPLRLGVIRIGEPKNSKRQSGRWRTNNSFNFLQGSHEGKHDRTYYEVQNEICLERIFEEE